MKILILVSIFASVAYCGRPNEFCWERCDWKGYNALINCTTPADRTEQQCTCFKKGGGGEYEDCGIDPGSDELKFDKWETCQTLAAAHSGLPDNHYFRYEKPLDSAWNVCYFLENCDVKNPSPCAPFEEATCVAGTTETGCSPEAPPACDRPTWVDEGIHWSCRLYNQPIDTYAADDSKLPKGTRCQTMKGCSTWTPETTPDVPPTEPLAIADCIDDVTGWKSEEPLKNSTDSYILPDVNDGVCLCNPLVLSEETLETTGLSLLCDTALSQNANDEFQIENGNACLLTCDGHFVLYVECYEGKWMNTAEFPFLEKGPNDIAC